VLGGGRRGTANGPNSSETPQAQPEEEEEKRETEEEPNEEELEANKPQEFKYCFFLKMQICIDKNTEIRKEVLNSNSQFNLNEAFRMFDQDNKGYITEADLALKINEMKVFANPQTIIQRFDRDGDGNLSYQEFRQMVTPLNRRYQASEYVPRPSSPQSLRSGNRSLPTAPAGNPRYLHLAWEDDLKEILFTLSNADDLLINERNNQQLDSEYLFKQIDKYGSGYITVRELADWIENVCGYRLQDVERDLINMRYARKTGYRITFDEFQEQVAPVMKSEDEVEEMEEGDGEVDPDAQPMEDYEEEFIGGGGNSEQIGGRDAMISGNEEDHSEDDTQMKNRYEVPDPRAAFFMQ